MAIMSDLRARADELRSLGLSKRRAFGVLKNEFPDAERDQLHLAVPLEGAPKGVTPQWALWGQPLRPCQIRYKQKGSSAQAEVKRGAPKAVDAQRKEVAMSETTEPLTITVEAKDLSVDDWVVPQGIVTGVKDDGVVIVHFKSGTVRVFQQQEGVLVRLEDRGEADE